MIDLSLVLRALETAGVQVDAETARDAVWIAARMAERRGPAETSVAGPAPADASAPPPTGAARAEQLPVVAEDDAGAGAATAAQSRTASGMLPATSLSRVRLPLAAGLARERGIPGALRPLRRRTRSAASRAIDETATVQRAIEDDLWLPIYRPVAERWLELALVVDEGLSMAVWQDVVASLRRVLFRAAAFRDVRLWRLPTEGPNAGRIQAAARTGDNLRSSARNPFGGGRRGLVLVVTDCVSDGWYDGRVLSQLHAWGHDSPVALLQVLPARMWPRTALANGAAVRLRAATPGVTNGRLHWVSDLPVAETEWRTHGAGLRSELLLLPVVTWAPDQLRRLARMIAGTSSESVDGVLFDPASVEPVATPPAVVSPKDRVRRFRSVSSAAACQLASLLAAAPAQSLGMLRLLRREMLPGSDPSAEAEVLFSGLVSVPLNASSSTGDIPLTLTAGVRQVLIESAPVVQVLQVLRTVASRISLPGISAATFESWIINPSAGEGQLRGADHPVAGQIAAVLGQVGGAYARIVHRDAAEDASASQATGASADSVADEVKGPDAEVRRSESEDSVDATADRPAQAAPEAATASETREVRIYVSLPAGANQERQTIAEVIEALNKTVSVTLGVHLQPLSWQAPSTAEGTGEVSKPMEAADLFIGVIPGARRLPVFVEREIDQAASRSASGGRPAMLLYVRNVPDSPESVPEYEQARVYTSAFIDRLSAQFPISRYSGSDELQQKLTIDIAGSLRALTGQVSTPREPRILQAIARAAPFVGRAVERGRLRQWFSSNDRVTRVLAVTGPAGIGKSALVSEWLADVAAVPPQGGVFVASGRNAVERVLAPAVEYFSGQPASPSDAYGLARRLSVALGRDRSQHLIVIDDFDQMGGEDGGVWESALWEGTAASNTRVLIVVRELMPPYAQALPLPGLAPEEVVELMRAHAVSEPDAALRDVAAWTGGSPAMLTLIAKALAAGEVELHDLVSLPHPTSPEELRELIDRQRSGFNPEVLAQLDEMIRLIDSRAPDISEDMRRQSLEIAQRVVVAGRRAGRRQLAEASLRLGTLLRVMGRYQEAIPPLQEAVVAYELENDRRAAAGAMREIGITEEAKEDLAAALRSYDTAADQARQLNDPELAAGSAIDGGRVALKLRDTGGAMERLQRALAVLESTGQPRPQAVALGLLGEAHRMSGDYESATGAFQHALALIRAIGDDASTASLLRSLGTAEAQAGELEKAQQHLSEALARFESLGAHQDVGDTAVFLARMVLRTGRQDEARSLLDRAVAAYQTAGKLDLAKKTSDERDNLGRFSAS